MFECEFYHLLNVKSEVDNNYNDDALAGTQKCTTEQGTRAGPIFFTIVFSQRPVKCQINHRNSKKKVLMEYILYGFQIITLRLLISR